MNERAYQPHPVEKCDCNICKKLKLMDAEAERGPKEPNEPIDAFWLFMAFIAAITLMALFGK